MEEYQLAIPRRGSGTVPLRPQLEGGSSHAMLSLQDVLQRGTLGALLRELDVIRATLGEDLKLAMPSIVVCGQESTGKSSVLERICMFPFFPRGSGVTTRIPIRLRMRRASPSKIEDLSGESNLEDTCMFVRVSAEVAGEITSKESLMRDPSESLEEFILDCQQFVLEKQSLRFADTPLTIEAWSPLLPDLDLVDLPGVIFTSTDPHQKDAARITQKLTRKYLMDPNTVPIVIVPGTIDRVRNDPVMGMIHECRREDTAVCVLTKSDLCDQRQYNRQDPFARLKARARGSASDCPQLGGGYVVVMNRDSQRDATVSLATSAEEEFRWFQHNVPELLEEGNATTRAVLDRVTHQLIQFTKSEWIPMAKRNLRGYRDVTQAKIAALGVDPIGISERELQGKLRNRMLFFMRRHAENETAIRKVLRSFFQTATSVPRSAPNLGRYLEKERKQSHFFHTLRNLKLEELAPLLCDGFYQASLGDQDLPLRLARFEVLLEHAKNHVEAKLRLWLSIAERQWKEAVAVLEVIDPDGKQRAQEHFERVIIRVVMLRVIDDISWDNLVPLGGDTFLENCAHERHLLNATLDALENVRKRVDELKQV